MRKTNSVTKTCTMLMFCMVVCILLLQSNTFAKSYGFYGAVKTGAGTNNNLDEKVWEYGEGNSNNTNYYYCFHAAFATSINIRLGVNVINLENVHKTFSAYFPSYRNSNPKREAGLSNIRQLGEKEKFSSCPIPDLKVILKQVKSDDASLLFNEIKSAVDNDYPIIATINSFRAKENSSYEYNNSRDQHFTAVYDFSGNVKHAIVLVGYLKNTSTNNTEDHLIAVRDTYMEFPFNSVRYKWFYDYTIPVKNLIDVLNTKNNKYDLMLVRCNKGGDFGKLVDGDSDINTFYLTYPSYFGTKIGDNYSSQPWIFQKFSNNKKIAVHNRDGYLWYHNGSKWYYYKQVNR